MHEEPSPEEVFLQTMLAGGGPAAAEAGKVPSEKAAMVDGMDLSNQDLVKAVLGRAESRLAASVHIYTSVEDFQKQVPEALNQSRPWSEHWERWVCEIANGLSICMATLMC